MWEAIAIIGIGVVAWLAFEVRAFRLSLDRRRLMIAAIFTCSSNAAAQQQPKPLELKPMKDDIHLAALDAKSLTPYDAQQTRYFTFANTICRTQQDVLDAIAILTFHLWCIAHEPEPPQMRRVGPTLYAIRLDEFGIDKFTFGRLLFRDCYHHVGLTKDGKSESDRAAAPIPGAAEDIAKLIECTGSQVPFLRWDWFFVESSIQEGRGEPGKGTGIYDFYGVTTRDELFKKVGADPKLAAEKLRLYRAIVKKSGVARFARQVQAFEVLGGRAYVTLDVTEQPTGKRNALRQLGDDFQHDAEEGYLRGPARMPWVYASTADGKLQASAPDKIGPDKTRHGNRTTIDVGASCFRCHIEILRPVSNWATETLIAPTTAEFPPEKAQALKRLHLRNMTPDLDMDRAGYAARLKECNGLEPKRNANLYGELRDKYDEDDLGIEETAWELGIDTKRWTEILTAVQVQKKLDPILADLTKKDGKIARESWEEVFPIALIYLGGQP